MRKFFSKIDRGKVLLAWEPRGDWGDHPEEIRKLCEALGLVHVVDPLRTSPLSLGPESTAYFRLHGFGKPSVYNYKYSDAELRRVARACETLEAKEIYCMFNNVEMFRDASRLQQIFSKG
jgi:uncharacterized protein YecE (DUF72 family)